MAVAVYTSTISDGSMKSHADDGDVVRRHDIRPDDTTLVRLTYSGNEYRRYVSLDQAHMGDGMTRPSTIVSDALVTTRPGHALFLPLADCVGVVLHSARRRANADTFGTT